MGFFFERLCPVIGYLRRRNVDDAPGTDRAAVGCPVADKFAAVYIDDGIVIAENTASAADDAVARDRTAVKIKRRAARNVNAAAVLVVGGIAAASRDNSARLPKRHRTARGIEDKIVCARFDIIFVCVRFVAVAQNKMSPLVHDNDRRSPRSAQNMPV